MNVIVLYRYFSAVGIIVDNSVSLCLEWLHVIIVFPARVLVEYDNKSVDITVDSIVPINRQSLKKQHQKRH